MHILLIPSWYKNAANPVAGSFFEEQARGLQKAGHQVGILVFDFLSFSSKNNKLHESYIDEGIPTNFFTYKAVIPRSRFINYILLRLFAYKEFKRYCKKYGTPQLIHAHSVFYGGIVAQYFSSRKSIPFVITEHLTNFITGELSCDFDLQTARSVFQSAVSNIIVSRAFRFSICKKLGLAQTLFKVIPNMVSPLFYETFQEVKISEKGPINIFTNSFLTPRKNHQLMLRAFSKVLKIYPNARFEIGGAEVIQKSNGYKMELLSLIDELGLGKKVRFLGSLSRIQVKETLDRSHLFVLASKYETFGVVLIEALASGRPVVSTDSEGPRDIVEPYNGIIVNHHAVDEFANAILQILSSYDKFDQNHIRQTCIDKFGEKKVVSLLEEEYRKCLS